MGTFYTITVFDHDGYYREYAFDTLREAIEFQKTKWDDDSVRAAMLNQHQYRN